MPRSGAGVYHSRFALPFPPMSRIPSLVLVALVAFGTTACGVLYRQPIYQGNLVEKSAADQLQAGMSKRQVAGLLGTPSIADPFHQDRWDYTATQRTGRTGKTEIKTFSVWFEGDALSRWEGEYFPEQDLELVRKANREFGPNLSRKDDKRRRR